MSDPLDVVVVGAGAAGLATAIFTARLKPGLRVTVLDGASKVGAKILVSGGGRCNVTHETVGPWDFWGGSPNVVRRILSAFNVERTIAFLEGDFHAALSGIAHPVQISVRVEGRKTVLLEGPMLWTHFGISGPAALDASRHWQRARLEGAAVTVTVNLIPGSDVAALEAKLLGLAQLQPRTSLRSALSTSLPGMVAEAVLDKLMLSGHTTMANLSREDRRTLAKALLEGPLPVAGGRGYNFAEVTAGGIPLMEVDPSTLGSRRCPGLYFTGEILDVDGRLGGYNFQWAWSSAWVVAQALARA